MGPYRARLEIRLSRELRSEIEATAKRTGETLTDFVRIALTAAVRNYPAPTPNDLEKFERTRRELGGAASNLNQFVRIANRCDYSACPEDIEIIQTTARELSRYSREIGQIIRMWS